MLNSDDRQAHDRPISTPPTTAEVRVLIVDDNRPFAEMLASALNSVDGILCVGTASSAVEGFQRVAELRPSVVVIDIMLPGLDGLAAATRLRQISPETAIAVTSPHGHNEWIARAEDAGASAYIPKGGSLADMIEVLRAARPGPVIVAPSLQAGWSPAKPPTPDPATAPRNPPSAIDKPSPALVRPSSRLRLKTRRVKRHVAQSLTAASRARRPKPFRW